MSSNQRRHQKTNAFGFGDGYITRDSPKSSDETKVILNLYCVFAQRYNFYVCTREKIIMKIGIIGAGMMGSSLFYACKNIHDAILIAKELMHFKPGPSDLPRATRLNSEAS